MAAGPVTEDGATEIVLGRCKRTVLGEVQLLPVKRSNQRPVGETGQPGHIQKETRWVARASYVAW
jgi:hypothetical protein